MKVEVRDESYRLLQEMVKSGRYASVEAALEGTIHLGEPEDETARIRAQVQEGIYSAEQGDLIDGEAFFQELRARRAKAA